jgi:AbrB family looped-hinge helix DNA binding protein
MIELTKASTKGQVVIPQGMRDALRIAPGDVLQIERVGDLIVIKKLTLSSLHAQLKQRGG